MQTQDCIRKAALPQPVEIAHGVLRPRQDEQIGRAEPVRLVYITYTYRRVLLQRGEVREVGDVRQADDGDVEGAARRLAPQPRGEAVLIVDIDPEPRHHAENRHTCQRFQLRKSRAQQLHVAAEFVDHRPDHALPLVLAQQGNRPVELGEDAAAVDIPREQNRRVHELGKAHVHNVVLAQVDLRRGARPLDDDHVILGGKALIGREDLGDQGLLHLEIVARVVLPAHLPHDDELAARVARGLEQDGIHAHVALDPRRLSLHGLGAAEFQPVWRDKAVERHVLALERGDAKPVLRENATERRAQQTLARAGHRPLYHDASRHQSTSPSAVSSASFSAAVRIAVRYQPGRSPG